MIQSVQDRVSGAALTIFAPGKLNLSLRVLGRRSDGFHEIRSLVIGCGIVDTVRLHTLAVPGLSVLWRLASAPTSSTRFWEAPLGCENTQIGLPELDPSENLAGRAAQAYAQSRGESPDVAIDIVKRIPIGAGMGGGSSDAAAVLKLCRELWGAPDDDAALIRLGASIGSDVPLFFRLPVAHIKGRGELVHAGDLRWSGWAVVAFVPVLVSTPAVYAELAQQEWSDGEGQDGSLMAEMNSAIRLNSLLHNDLEPAVFRVAPIVRETVERIREEGFGRFVVSGAGAALFRLFDEEDSAKWVAESLFRSGVVPRIEVTQVPTGAGSVFCEEA